MSCVDRLVPLLCTGDSYLLYCFASGFISFPKKLYVTITALRTQDKSSVEVFSHFFFDFCIKNPLYLQPRTSFTDVGNVGPCLQPLAISEVYVGLRWVIENLLYSCCTSVKKRELQMCRHSMLVFLVIFILKFLEDDVNTSSEPYLSYSRCEVPSY